MADDVVYHYDRQMGTGEFTEPSPLGGEWLKNVISVEATDTHTVVFNFRNPTIFNNFMIVNDPASSNVIEPREVVEAGVADWHNAAGTGAFILSEFVSGSSMTLTKNPNYWGYDERHPENKLPYVDEVKVLLIPDNATALSALRSGQVDWMTDIQWTDAELLEESNPEIVLSSRPFNGWSLSLRCDMEPYTDINVRKAMQMAINLDELAETYYGGLVSGDPQGPVSPENVGWVVPYEEWSDDLKAEYAFDPEGAMALLDAAGYTADPATE